MPVPENFREKRNSLFKINIYNGQSYMKKKTCSFVTSCVFSPENLKELEKALIISTNRETAQPSEINGAARILDCLKRPLTKCLQIYFPLLF